MKITKEKVNSLRTEIEAALSKTLSQHNLSVQLGSLKFDETGFDGKITVSVIKNGIPATPEAQAWPIYAAFHNLEHFSVGDKFRFPQDSTVYTIAGWNKRASKKPVILKNAKNKEFVTRASNLKFAIKI
jgi:hypothetical protein